jgi:hypothetical protein
MKFSQWLGILSCIVLIISGFMNWTWYPDIRKFFTGFETENNMYGKPGKIFIYISIVAIAFFLTPKLWAKRWNVLICTIIIAYAVKSFILFSACYRGICPEKQPGIWLMLVSACLTLVFALLPDLKVKDKTSSPE